MGSTEIKRRGVLELITASATALAVPWRLRAAEVGPDDWRTHFATLAEGAILADTRAAQVHFWSAGGDAYRCFACSLPDAAELRRSGRTEVMRKVVGPTWRPTPSMRAADPTLPLAIVAGPGNPFGSHALYLGWRHVRLHGGASADQLGRRIATGCFGLADADIAELFARARIGTPVRVA